MGCKFMSSILGLKPCSYLTLLCGFHVAVSIQPKLSYPGSLMSIDYHTFFFKLYMQGFADFAFLGLRFIIPPWTVVGDKL